MTGSDDPLDRALAKDVLDQRPPRPTLGERLCQRIGSRRWERAPIVSCTGRLFERYSLADPWEPDSTDHPLALGPVGMKFEERRQPAPHARVKQPKQKSSGPTWTPPKGIPDAPTKRVDPAPTAAERRSSPHPPTLPTPTRPKPSDDDAEQPGQPSSVGPATGKGKARTSAGRFRMRPTTTSGPRIRRIPAVVEAPSRTAPAPQPDSPPPPAPQSLDDLFGSLGAGGRDKRVGRKKKEED